MHEVLQRDRPEVPPVLGAQPGDAGGLQRARGRHVPPRRAGPHRRHVHARHAVLGAQEEVGEWRELRSRRVLRCVPGVLQEELVSNVRTRIAHSCIGIVYEENGSIIMEC